MTYAQLCASLQSAGIESAAWEAALLIEHYTGTDQTAIKADPSADHDCDALLQALSRRMAHEPLQYILGEWAFYRQSYLVSSDCLIPRADTELLVEQAIALLPQGACFADLCTGSGCIAISTLAERPDTRAWAGELSAAALALARQNAERNGVLDRLTLAQCDVLKPETVLSQRSGGLDALLSNPPYIKSDVIPTLSQEVRCEPHMALDGGADGLIFYRALLKLAAALLKPDGFCLLEIGFDQGADICALAEEAGFSCRIKQDLGGCDRVAYLVRRGI